MAGRTRSTSVKTATTSDRQKVAKQKVTNAVHDRTKGLSRQTVGRFRAKWLRQKNVGPICERGGQDICWKKQNAVQLETSIQGGSRVSCDLRFVGTSTRQAVKAEKAGDWAGMAKSDRLNSWTSAKLQGCYKGIVLQILQKITDFPRRIIVPVGGRGVRVPALSSVSAGRPHLVGLVRARRPECDQFVACSTWSKRWSKRAGRHTQRTISYTASSWSSWRTSSLGGDSPVEVLVEGLQERSGWSFEGSQWTTRRRCSLTWETPKFTADLPQPTVREGANELTL